MYAITHATKARASFGGYVRLILRIQRAIVSCVTVAVVLVLFAGFTAAQTNEGQLAGNVVDSTGALVADAKLSAKNEATGSTYNAVSTSVGSYRFPSIQLGRYTVTVAATGFKQSISTHVEVRVGSVTGFDVHLSTGGTTETVVVDADAPAVETQSSDVGGVITARQIVELPLALGGVGAMRAPEAFIFLVPGTAGPGTGNSNNGIFVSKIGGGQNFGNEVLIDGVSQTRSENGSSFDEESPSVEAISEFKVTTSTPSAEFGRTTGGIENFVTKGGGNQYHGTVFELFQNEALNANNYFSKGIGAISCPTGDPVCLQPFRRGADKKNDFGGSVGGPLSIPHLYNGKDKTFFFFSWEQFKQKLSSSVTSTVPTTAEIGGDFSARLIGGATGQINPCDGTPILFGQIFDPSTTQTITQGSNVIRCRTAFPGNKIPTARLSPVALKILKFYPSPANNSLGGNYTNNAVYPINNTTYTVRIDQNISDSSKIWATYNTRENFLITGGPQTFPGVVDPNQWPQDFVTHFVRAGWDYILTPNLLNHAVLGFNRSYSSNFGGGSASGINYAAQLGIGNIAGFGFPYIDPNQDIPAGNPGKIPHLSKNQSDLNVDNGGRFLDSVSWQHGRSSFKIGFDYRYQQYSAIAHDGENGTFNFSGNQTKSSDNPGLLNGTGNGLASLLLGDADFGGSSKRLHQPRWISNYWAGFIQDDFKASKTLTLNIGVRYDIDQPRREALNNTSNFSLTAIDPHNGRPGAFVFGTNCNCNNRWAATWFKDFAPRIGFAFAPERGNGKMVVRGGFSTLYGPLQYSDFGGSTIQGYSASNGFGSDGFNPAFTIDSGLPAPLSSTPNLDPGLYDNGNADSPRFVDGSYVAAKYGRPPMVNQWNLQVQQEFAKDLIFTIGYIGQAASHLRSGVENINNIPISQFSRGDQLTQHDLASAGVPPPYAGFNGQVQQALRPFPQYGFIATDCCLQNVGHASYNALIASVERRFRNGLNLQGSYTWSKDITNADSSLPGINGGVNQEQNPFDSKSQKALSIQDIPHTFVVSYIYELPFGKGRMFLNGGGILNYLVGGFSIGGVQRYQSGEPISFGCADGIPGFDNCISFSRVPGSHISSGLKHPDVFALRKLGFNRAGPDPKVDSIFNGLARPDAPGYAALQPAPAFFSQNAPFYRKGGAFQFGNVPRVTSEARNFKYYNEDFSLIKNTPITERINFQLKGEFLNAFNRHVFSTPDTNPYDNGFGVPTGLIDTPRFIQITGRITF